MSEFYLKPRPADFSCFFSPFGCVFFGFQTHHTPPAEKRLSTTEPQSTLSTLAAFFVQGKNNSRITAAVAVERPARGYTTTEVPATSAKPTNACMLPLPYRVCVYTTKCLSSTQPLLKYFFLVPVVAYKYAHFYLKIKAFKPLSLSDRVAPWYNNI